MADDFSELVVPWLTGELPEPQRSAFAEELEQNSDLPADEWADLLAEIGPLE